MVWLSIAVFGIILQNAYLYHRLIKLEKLVMIFHMSIYGQVSPSLREYMKKELNGKIKE